MTKFLLFTVFLFIVLSAKSQCSSDPVVTDTDKPGEIFPLTFTARAGNPLSLNLTILPPPTGILGTTSVTLTKIVLRAISRKPSWFSYISNANIVQTGTITPVSGYEFVVGTRYCMKISGTPDGSFIGTDSMNVMVDAYTLGGYLVAENSNGGGIYYTICSQADTACIPTQGEIYPRELQFKQTKNINNFRLSFVPPSQFAHNGNVFNLNKIVLKNITGKPAWLNYYVNTTASGSDYDLLIGKKYSVIFTGTADSSFIGTDTLRFIGDIYNTATPPALIASNVEVGKIKFNVCVKTDNMCFPSGIEEQNTSTFSLIENYTNIFDKNVSLNFNSDIPGEFNLHVYNLLGQKIYNDTQKASHGKNSFNINSELINPGNYIFSIDNGKTKLTGRFIKTQ